jgi:hypothetical protein
MAFRISGFGAEQREKKEMVSAYEASRRTVVPRKSLVQVRFPGKGMALTYFNDLFDLKVGDRVYVDGKLEGQLGLVTEISYNFKIKISDYKKVIAVVDTDVHGQFHMAGSHFITFDPTSLPAEQVSMWFKAPAKEDEEIIDSLTEKYRSWDWTFGRKIPFTLSAEERFPWGSIRLELAADKGIITDVRIFSDAMDDTVAPRLEEALRNQMLAKESVHRAIDASVPEFSADLQMLIDAII